jgi:hypothetical protein
VHLNVEMDIFHEEKFSKDWFLILSSMMLEPLRTQRQLQLTGYKRAAVRLDWFGLALFDGKI